MNAKPTLYVCSVDDRGPGLHPCQRAQQALEAAGIDFDKEIGAKNRPFGIGTKGRRPELLAQIGTEKLPALILPDGTIIEHAHAIQHWATTQRQAS